MLLLLFKQELFSYRKSYGKILHNFLFFLVSFCIFFLISSAFADQISSKAALIYNVWLCLLFNILFINSDFLKEEFEDGSLEQILIKLQNFEIFIIAKILSSWLIFCLPIISTASLLAIALGLGNEFSFKLFTLLLFASLAINFITSFSGCLSLLDSKMSTIAIIVMPLALPILLISCKGIVDYNDIENFYLSLKILFGLTILSAVFCSIFAAKIIKITYE